MTIGQGRQKKVDDLDIRHRTYDDRSRPTEKVDDLDLRYRIFNDRSRSTKKILDNLDTTYK